MKKHLRVGLALVAASSMLLTACGGNADSAAGDDETFTVLAVSPLSGPLATLGQLQVAGLETAAAVLNDRGGIDGRQVEVESVDNAGDAAKAVQALQGYLSENDKPDMLMPGLTSQEIVAVLPLATQNEILTVHLGAAIEANDPEKFPLTFGASPTFAAIQEIAVDYLKEQGFSKIAFLGTDTASSRYQIEAFEALADDNDVTITSEIVAPDSADVTATLLKLKATDPDVLWLAGSGPIVGAYLSGLETVKWEAPVVGSSEICATDLGKLAEPEAYADLMINCYAFAVESQPLSESEIFKEFRTNLAKHAETPIQTSVMTPAFTYNELIIAAAAYEGAGELDAKAAAAALVDGKAAEDIRELYIGPADWDFTDDDHSMTWGPEDLIYVPAAPMSDGMIAAAQ
jgi:branched-chain amino acid transport system substrate-binding protein